MGRFAPEVADIFRIHGPAWRQAQRAHLSLGQLKVMSAIELISGRSSDVLTPVRPRNCAASVAHQPNIVVSIAQVPPLRSMEPSNPPIDRDRPSLMRRAYSALNENVTVEGP